MSITSPEYPSIYGALDSAIYVDGDACDAAVLREIARSANRLLAVGHPLINWAFDAKASGESGGMLLGWGYPFWMQILPGPVTRPKKPGLTRASLRVRATARSGERIYIQIATMAAPYDPAANGTASNVLTITGTGSAAWYELDDIPIDYGGVDYVTIYAMGEPTSTAGSTGTYGSPNTGDIDRVDGDGRLVVLDTTWSTTPGSTWADGGHAVIITDAAGEVITAPRWIIDVVELESQLSYTGSPPTITVTDVTPRHGLVVYPPLPPGLGGAALRGLTFSIVELAQWRLDALVLQAQDRT